MEDRELLRRYLLGTLSENERHRVEKECCADGALNERLQSEENDLIDAYVCEELSEEQRRQFEGFFLDSPEKHARVEIAQMLMNPAVREMVAVGPIAERKSKPASSWWKPYFANPFGLAAASLALAALTVFFATQNLRLRNELERSRSAQLELQSQVDKLRQPVVSGNTQIQAKVEPPQLPHISMASIMLSPGLLRSGGGAQSHLLMLPRGVSTAVVMLRLEQSMKYSGFDVVLQTVDGKEVRRLKALKSRPAPDGGYMVAAHFPARLLEEGDYLVTLQGRTASGEIKDLDSYSFSVTR